MLLAMVVGFVGSLQLQAVRSGSIEHVDRGMSGVAAQRVDQDVLPTGKPIYEAEAERSENERESESEELFVEGEVHVDPSDTLIRLPWPLGPPPSLRDRAIVERVGARGPPIG